jgi:hypothetical protein
MLPLLQFGDICYTRIAFFVAGGGGAPSPFSAHDLGDNLLLWPGKPYMVNDKAKRRVNAIVNGLPTKDVGTN